MSARVSLNKEELEFLLDVCKNNAKLHRKLRKALALTEWKEDDLVLKNDSPIKSVSIHSMREHAYVKWCNDPTTCTDEEEQLATDYRYNNNMMSEQEAEDYETLLNSKFGDL